MDKFTKYSLLFIVIALPLQVFSIYLGFSLLLVRVVFLTSMLIYIFRGLQRGSIKIPKTFLDFNILFLVIINFIISIFAIDIFLSIREAFLQILLIVFMYYIIILINSKEKLDFAINTYINTAIIIAIYGLYQQVGFIYGWDTNLPFQEYFSFHENTKNPFRIYGVDESISSLFIRIRGTFLDTNIFAGFIVSAIGLSIVKLIYVYSGNEKISRIKYLSFVTFFITVLFITMSRSALVGFFILLIVVFFYYKKELFNEYILLKVATIILTISALVLFIFPEIYELVINVFDSFFISRKFVMRSKSAELHIQIASEGISMFLQNPITGVGLNNFKIYFAQNNTVWYTGSTNKIMMAHSIFLSFIAEGGLIGAVANISIIVVIIYYSHNSIKSIDNSLEKSIMVGTFSSYIGVLGCNIFYQYFLQEFVWFITALNVSAIYVLKNQNIGMKMKK